MLNSSMFASGRQFVSFYDFEQYSSIELALRLSLTQNYFLSIKYIRVRVIHQFCIVQCWTHVYVWVGVVLNYPTSMSGNLFAYMILKHPHLLPLVWMIVIHCIVLYC